MTFDTDRVRAVAQAQLASDPEGGAGLSVFVNGVEVLNETWGVADRNTQTPYRADTLQIVQSMGKGVIAAAATLLIGRGQLDPAHTVATYWPAFGTPDKLDITVGQLFSHQAGLLYLDGTMPLDLTLDRDALEAALVAQSPAWKPGTKVGYSPQTFGNYADLLFEHATGRGFADLLTEITTALDIEMYVGLPREQWHRAALAMTPTAEALAEAIGNMDPQLAADFADPNSLMSAVMRNIPGSQDPMYLCNGEAIRTAFLPAGNMFGSAHAFAALYDALVRSAEGDTLFDSSAVETATSEVSRGIDACLHTEAAFGLGFMKPSSTYPFSPNPRAFGHAGAGGSIAMADPDAGLAMCWLPNRYASSPFDSRMVNILEAIYAEVE